VHNSSRLGLTVRHASRDLGGWPVLAEGVHKPRLTPAVVEQLCAEHENVADFLVSLEEEVGATRRAPGAMKLPK
jgi:hypothetical protein